MMCKICGCQLHSPSPPKRPRRNRADSATGERGGLGVGGIPNSTGFPAATDRQNAAVSTSASPGATSGTTLDRISAPVQSGRTSSSLFVSASQTAPTATSLSLNVEQPSSFLATTVASTSTAQIFSATTSWTVAGVSGVGQSPTSSSTTAVSLNLPAVRGHCSSSEQLTFSSPLSVPCSDSARPGSAESSHLPAQLTTPSTVSCTTSTPLTSRSLNTSDPASSTGPILAGQSELYRSSDGQCSAASVEVSRAPNPTQFLSTTTKASSAPVVGSLIADRQDESSASAPPSLFPLVNQPSLTPSSICTPAYSSPSSTVSNQFLGQSSTSCTSSRASVKGQASGSMLYPQVCCPAPVSSSGGQVFGWSAATTGSSTFTSASTQSNAVIETQTFVNSTQNLCSSPQGDSSSTHGRCSTASFTGGFSVQSSTITQSFGSPLPASNCTVSTTSSSTFPFQFGTGSTTQSSMDYGQPLGTPASPSTNCQTPVTTCWRWHSNDTSSQVSSTLAPSTRSSPIWPTFSRAESDDRFGSASEQPSTSCQSTTTPFVFGFSWTSGQSTTAVDVSVTSPPTTLFQSPCQQQQSVHDRRSSTSVSWASQNTVMSTTSSQPAPRDAQGTSPFGILITIRAKSIEY